LTKGVTSGPPWGGEAPGSVRPMAGRVVLFGATGYMGERAARALAARGVRPVLAARRAAALYKSKL